MTCIPKTRFSIKSCRHLALKHYSNNIMLHFALLLNALARRRKVIASISPEPLSHPSVIALSKFEPLSLLKLIALDSWHKQEHGMLLHFKVTLPTSGREGISIERQICWKFNTGTDHVSLGWVIFSHEDSFIHWVVNLCGLWKNNIKDTYQRNVKPKFEVWELLGDKLAAMKTKP